MHPTDSRRPGPPLGLESGPVPDGGRVHYDDGGVCVSGRWFTAAGRRYAVSELRAARTARGPYPPLATATATAAAVVLFAIAVGWQYLYRDPVAWVGIVTVAVAAVGLPLLALRLLPRPYELWAEYFGATHLLHATSSPTVHREVCRALLRSMRERAALDGDASGEFSGDIFDERD